MNDNPTGAARFRRLQELFDEAVEIESAALEAFLDRRCAGDQGLRDEVASLVRRERTRGLLDAPGAGVRLENSTLQVYDFLMGLIFIIHGNWLLKIAANSKHNKNDHSLSKRDRLSDLNSNRSFKAGLRFNTLK